MDDTDVYGRRIVPAMGRSGSTRGTIQLAFVDEKILKEIKNKIIIRLIGTELQAWKATVIIQELGWFESARLPGAFVLALPE